MAATGATSKIAIEECDEIWSFVEQKWKLNIPAYFKNVLKVCGYNNGISISSIGDEDIKYIESEVRNGNVMKYFRDMDEENVLKDCTMSAESFVFTMGHRKWLMTIVGFLKKHLEENGSDGFTIEDNPPKEVKKKAATKTKRIQKLSLPRKRKFSEAGFLVASIIAEKFSKIQVARSDIEDVDQHIKVILEKTLEKTIISLTLPPFTSEMFDENVKSVKKRISSGCIEIESNIVTNVDHDESTEEPAEEVKLTASISCFLCGTPIGVHHKPTGNNFFLWQTSNYNRHLLNVHLEENNNFIPKKIVQEEDAMPSKRVKNNEVNCTISSAAKALLLEKSMKQVDNIKMSIVQEEVAIPFNGVVEKPLKKIKNREVNCTITSEANSFTSERSMNQVENIDTAIVQKEGARVVKEATKKIKNREANSAISSEEKALKLEKSVKLVENIEQEKVAILPKRVVKVPLKKVKNREVTCTMSSEAKSLTLEKSMDQVENIETSIVQKELAIPPKRDVKEPVKKIKNREGNSTISSEEKALMLEKSVKNIQPIIVQKEVTILHPKSAVTVPPKKIENREVTCIISSEAKAFMLKKSMKQVANIGTSIIQGEVAIPPKIKLKEPLVPSIVCYSDTSEESGEDQESEALPSRDRILNSKQRKDDPGLQRKSKETGQKSNQREEKLAGSSMKNASSQKKELKSKLQRWNKYF